MEILKRASGDHSGALFWTPGCHGGLNAPPETPVALDTAQAWAARRALVEARQRYYLDDMRPGDSYHPSQVFLPLVVRER